MTDGRNRSWQGVDSSRTAAWPTSPPPRPPMAPPEPASAPPAPPPPTRSRVTTGIAIAAAFALGIVGTVVVTSGGEAQVVDHAVVQAVDDTTTDPPDGSSDLLEDPTEEGATTEAPPTAAEIHWVEIDPRLEDAPLATEEAAILRGPAVVSALINHDGATYLFGRADPDWPSATSVWSTLDGRSWNALGEVVPAGGRFSRVVTDGRTLTVGGSSAEGAAAIWTSADGTNWTEEIVHQRPDDPWMTSYVGALATGNGRTIARVEIDLDTEWVFSQLPDVAPHLGLGWGDVAGHVDIRGPLGLLIERQPFEAYGIPTAAVDDIQNRSPRWVHYVRVDQAGDWRTVEAPLTYGGYLGWDETRQVFIDGRDDGFQSVDGISWEPTTLVHAGTPRTWRGLSVSQGGQHTIVVSGTLPEHGLEIDMIPLVGAIEHWSISTWSAAESALAVSLRQSTSTATGDPANTAITVDGATLTYDPSERTLTVEVRDQTHVYPVSDIGFDAESGVTVDADRLVVIFSDPSTSEPLAEFDLAALEPLQERVANRLSQTRFRTFATADGDIWQELDVELDPTGHPRLHVTTAGDILILEQLPEDDPGLAVSVARIDGASPRHLEAEAELADLAERNITADLYAEDDGWVHFNVGEAVAGYIAEEVSVLDEGLNVLQLLDVDGIAHMITEESSPVVGATPIHLWRWTGEDWSDLGLAAPEGHRLAAARAANGVILLATVSPEGNAEIATTTDGASWTRTTVAEAPEPWFRQSFQAVVTDGERTIIETEVRPNTSSWAPPAVAAFGEHARWRWQFGQERIEVTGPFSAPLASIAASEAELPPALVELLDRDRREYQLHIQRAPGEPFEPLVIEGPELANSVWMTYDTHYEAFVLRDRRQDPWFSNDAATWRPLEIWGLPGHGYWQGLSISHYGTDLTVVSPTGDAYARTDLQDLLGQGAGWRSDTVTISDRTLALTATRVIGVPTQRPAVAVEVGDVTLTADFEQLVVERGGGRITLPLDESGSLTEGAVDFDMAANRATFTDRASGEAFATVPVDTLAALARARFDGPVGEPTMRRGLLITSSLTEWTNVSWDQGSHAEIDVVFASHGMFIVESSVPYPGATPSEKVLRTFWLDLD